MGLSYGFYNSVNGDRTYDALDMGQMFDGVFTDGVFNGFGDVFAVTPNSGLTVNVGSGRAWFNHTWSYNDSAMQVTFDANSESTTRQDIIYLKVDATDAVRANSIEVSKGNAYGAPVVPADTLGVYNHPIAMVAVKNTGTITAADIHMLLGTGSYLNVNYTPFVQVANVNVNATLQNLQNDFDVWFGGLQYILDGDVAGHLQNEIEQIDTVLTANTKIVGIVVKDNLTVDHGVASTVTWSSSNVPDYNGVYKIVSRVPYQISIENASSSGKGSSLCHVSTVDGGSCVVRNMHASSNAKIRVRCYFMYQKDIGYGTISG